MCVKRVVMLKKVVNRVCHTGEILHRTKHNRWPVAANDLAHVGMPFFGRAANEKNFHVLGSAQIKSPKKPTGSHDTTKQRIPRAALARITITEHAYDQLIVHDRTAFACRSMSGYGGSSHHSENALPRPSKVKCRREMNAASAFPTPTRQHVKALITAPKWPTQPLRRGVLHSFANSPDSALRKKSVRPLSVTYCLPQIFTVTNQPLRLQRHAVTSEIPDPGRILPDSQEVWRRM